MLSCLKTKAKECKDVSDFIISVTMYDDTHSINAVVESLPPSTILKSFQIVVFVKLKVKVENYEN